MKKKLSTSRKKSKKISIDDGWQLINAHAAGIDIGSRENWVCVPPDAAGANVRKFGTFTADLEAMAQWLVDCGVSSVAMEATGVYWIPAFQILERRGLKVILANARQTKNVAGRKSDVMDCQWIQRLHTYGLLQGSFRPADPYCVLRTYLRYRDELVAARSTQCQHMQKALQQMNIQLTQVLSDVTGVSGLAIIGAIVEGQRDPAQLAALTDRRVRASQAAIQEALRGDYRPEHLFVLRQAFELYHTFEAKIAACDQELAQEMERLPDKVDVAAKPLPARKEGRKPHLDKLGGQDFCSWLGLCPDNRISGGKVLSSRTRRVVNRLSDAFRMAASTLERSQSALGGFYRRMKARLGAAEAVTATAHKLARITYRLVKHGEAYVRQGLEDYEKRFRQRRLMAVQRSAKAMGFQLVPNQPVASGVS